MRMSVNALERRAVSAATCLDGRGRDRLDNQAEQHVMNWLKLDAIDLAKP